MSGVRIWYYRVSDDASPEELKEVIRQSAPDNKQVIFVYKNRHYHAFNLAFLLLDQLGTDFLREVVELGYQEICISAGDATILDRMINDGKIDEKWDTVSLLVELGCKFVRNLGPFLMWEPKVELVQRLLDLGQEWSKKSILCYVRSVEMARFLLELGAEINEEVIVESPLELIEFYCRECGFDINKKTEDGYTILCRMAYRGNFPEIIRGVIALGADPEKGDARGKTPKEIYGPERWNREIQLAPFMAEVDGQQWRFSKNDDRTLRAESLGPDGLVERLVGYECSTHHIFVAFGDRLLKV